MSVKSWTAVIGRITSLNPTNLDHLLAPLDPRKQEGGSYYFPVEAGERIMDTPFARPTTLAFGARITKDTRNRVQLAMNLAMMAAEKDAEPIILSHIAYSGLERFGFRVERVAGATDEERQAAEDQLIAFWNIVMVI